MTFDLDLWPTDLKINRIIHSPRIIYLPSLKLLGQSVLELFSCTRWSKLAWPLTFDLLTWKSIGIIYSPRTIYLPSLKLLGQSVIELSVAQGEGLPTYRPTDRHTDRPTDRCKAICPPFSKGGIKITGSKYPRSFHSFAKYFLPPYKDNRNRAAVVEW